MGNVDQLAFDFTCSVGGPFTLSPVPRLDGVPFLDLGNGWALAADKNQWILKKAKAWRGGVKWQPVAYVGSNKAVLMRVMRKEGIAVPPDASAAVNRFFAAEPARFIEWRDGVSPHDVPGTRG